MFFTLNSWMRALRRLWHCRGFLNQIARKLDNLTVAGRRWRPHVAAMEQNAVVTDCAIWSFATAWASEGILNGERLRLRWTKSQHSSPETVTPFGGEAKAEMSPFWPHLPQFGREARYGVDFCDSTRGGGSGKLG